MRNYLSDMLYALTSAYSRKDYDNCQQKLPLETNIGKLFSILAEGLGSIEEKTEVVKLWDNLDYACGSVLDRYGANFGVKRISPDDRFYRLAINVKVMAQLSGGDTDTVIRAAGALLDVNPSDVLLEDVYPAKITLYVDTELLSQERLELIELVAYAIKRILAAGVGMRLYLRTYRAYRCDLILLQCGHVKTHVYAEPVGKDRESSETWDVNYGGFVGTALEPPPFSEDRVAQMPVQLSRGTVQTSIVVSATDTERAHNCRQSGAGGAIYHTHIKSKRID